MPYRALITGAAGFVGTYLAEHLLECGDAVLGSSIDGSWQASSPESLQGRVELVAWDLASHEGIPRETRQRIEHFRPDCLYHLAAMSVPEDCGEGEPLGEAVAINVEGTRRVLQLAASLPSRPRVLFTSSSHVYARVPAESPRVAETAPLGPWRGYGRTKLAAEGHVRQAVDNGCDALIARSFQHAGPRQNPRMMLAQWASQFAVGGDQPVEVHTLEAQVDVTDGRDVARAYRLLMQHGRRGEVYNVGSGLSRPSGHILDLLRQLADPSRPVVQSRPGRKQDPIADTTRIARETGWSATIPLERTVADTLSWWQDHLQRKKGL